MKHLLLTVGALAGALLLLTSAADAGERDGRARGARSGTPRSSAGVGSSRGLGSRSAPSRARMSRPFSSPSRSTTFPGRTQLPSRSRVPSTNQPFSSARTRALPSTSRARTPSTPSVLYGPRSRTTTRGSGFLGRSQGARVPSAAEQAAQRARSQAAFDRLRQGTPRTTAPRSGLVTTSPRTRVPSRGIGASSTRDTTARTRSGIFGTPGTDATRARVGSTRVGSTGIATPRVGTTRVGGTRVGSTRVGSVRTTDPRLGTTSVSGSRFGSRTGSVRVSGSRTAVAGSAGRAVTGGSVRVRPGTRSGRVGRSYRIGGLHDHYHHHHTPWLGYYYSWYPYASWPYYRVYPRYGLYFGFGVSWYGPAYETYFVDAADYYYPGEVIVEEEVIEEVVEQPVLPAPQGIGPAPIAPAPAAPAQGFPPPAPQADEAPVGPDGEVARAPHPDFEPAVQAFLDGRYQEALERLDRVTRDEPDNGEAWLAVMHADFALGRYGAAGVALARAAALEAFPRGYRFDVRPLYAKQAGSYDRFVQALDAHVARNPRDADALLVRAYLHLAQGDKGPARQALDMVLEQRPADETAPRLAMALLPPPPPPSDAQNPR